MNWQDGLQDEIGFWDGFIKQHMGETWRFDGTKQVHPAFRDVLMSTAKRLNKRTEELKILDVGCGCYDVIGGICDGERLQVTHTDYLADSFNEILRRYGLDKYPFKPVFQDMTNLNYGDGEFDIVHCLNALDHCSDALKAIDEMKRVAKSVVYTGHFKNVERSAPEGRKGLHTWNIDMQNGGLHLWRGDKHYIAEGFQAYDDPYIPRPEDTLDTSLVKVIGVLEK